MKPHIVGFIFARGGSKGVPKKNIKNFAGKPLIAYSIETAQKSNMIDRLVVSTDSEEIANIAIEYGAEVPFIRPKKLAGDDAPEIMAWKHAIDMLNNDKNASRPDIFVSIPTTSPLRIVDDIDTCIHALLESDADLVITVKASDRNPYFNMVVIDEQKFAELVIKPEKNVVRRQEAPTVYDMTTVCYAAKPDYILKTDKLLEGKIKAVIIPPERAIDIDTKLDFEIAEFLMMKRIKK